MLQSGQNKPAIDPNKFDPKSRNPHTQSEHKVHMGGGDPFAALKRLLIYAKGD